MKKRLLILVSVLLLTISGAVLAKSPDGGARCEDLRGRIVLVSFEEYCNFNGVDYFWCVSNKVKGKTKGTLQGFIKYEWAGVSVDPLVDSIDGSENLWYREDDVLELRRGRIIGSAQYTVDTRLWDVGGAVPIPIVITGGTGIYKDASGWMLTTSRDFFETAKLSGEVCGPYIPGRRDRDDDGGDD